MDIKKSTSGNTTSIVLSGRLDTVTSGKLANELDTILKAGAVNLVFDFLALEYISSAGLRVLLTTQKKINAQGTEMRITKANDTVKEVFEITGFTSIIKIS
jgi:anti-sigma B factor antagonist